MKPMDILQAIRQIKENCVTYETFLQNGERTYAAEVKSVEAQRQELISSFSRNRDKFIEETYGVIEGTIRGILQTLEDLAQHKVTMQEVQTYAPSSGNKNISVGDDDLVEQYVERINSCIAELNTYGFDTALPEEIEFTGSGKDSGFVSIFGTERIQNTDPQVDKKREAHRGIPADAKKMIIRTCALCTRALEVVGAKKAAYIKATDLPGFEAYLASSAKTWLREKRSNIDGEGQKKFDELFADGPKAIPAAFFEEQIRGGTQYLPDPTCGSDHFSTKITLGKFSTKVVDKKEHIEHIQRSPILSKYIDKKGNLFMPFILDLKARGNVILNVDQDEFDENVLAFIHQIILQYLVAFPASRINLCLIDIDDKADFSHYKMLIKVNNNMLFKGIIRDDRQLEDTIKDMVQTMYRINEDRLSFNGVADIFEYNATYETTPQTIHLFVLVNYPSGMREDVAKQLLKLMQGGNKCGIFTFLVNNAACPLPQYYKSEEVTRFLSAAQNTAVNISYSCKDGTYSIVGQGNTEFMPAYASQTINPYDIGQLPQIVQMLKNQVESGKKVNVLLDDMFRYTDDEVAGGNRGKDSILNIPIGKNGGEIQDLLLDSSGTGSAHAVIIGGTGSGKSNLLHTIILSACYRYSPEELNLYLIDFKGGVEFKYYENHQLPHIKLTGLTSDLEDGVAILHNLQNELHRRENLFRNANVEDLLQYRRAGNVLPCLLVIIDEIQELFEQNETLGAKAINILRELFKKGRALGINLIWASQNVPHTPGLKDKVLSQIGNRISLRLNEPNDALDIMIDPRVVRNLNRPEKGLAVINDIRYNGEAPEFRVAYAESSKNRHIYIQSIADKWASVTASMKDKTPLYIVGEDKRTSPVEGVTLYNTALPIENKFYGAYAIQLGLNYISGASFNVPVMSRGNKHHVLFAGSDMEVLRDMMGYALLSVVANRATDSGCKGDTYPIYYTNGEMVNPLNSSDLYNVIPKDFSGMFERLATRDDFKNCIRELYLLFKKRNEDINGAYQPVFLFVHSMQRFADLFSENPVLQLEEGAEQEKIVTSEQSPWGGMSTSTFGMGDFSQPSGNAGSNGKTVRFATAFKELIASGAEMGIHLVLSVDNPNMDRDLATAMKTIAHKIFVYGIKNDAINSFLSSSESVKAPTNPRIAVYVGEVEVSKVRIYRYDADIDGEWYEKTKTMYSKKGDT